MLDTVIFAFHGMGKSYLANHDQRFVDLDLAGLACLGFHCDILYDDLIISVLNRNLIPLVNSPSCLPLLSRLSSQGDKVFVILPEPNSLTCLKRMIDRGQCPNPRLVEKTLSEVEQKCKELNLTLIRSDSTLSDLIKGGLLE
jgi:hypothetical protein